MSATAMKNRQRKYGIINFVTAPSFDAVCYFYKDFSSFGHKIYLNAKLHFRFLLKIHKLLIISCLKTASFVDFGSFFRHFYCSRGDWIQSIRFPKQSLLNATGRIVREAFSSEKTTINRSSNGIHVDICSRGKPRIRRRHGFHVQQRKKGQRVCLFFMIVCVCDGTNFSWCLRRAAGDEQTQDIILISFGSNFSCESGYPYPYCAILGLKTG